MQAPPPTHSETGEQGGDSTWRHFRTHALNIWNALREKNGILHNLITVTGTQALSSWLASTGVPELC